MVGIGGVFQLNFPVARKAETMLTRNLNRIARTLFHEQINPFFRRAQKVFQRLNFRIKGGKNHAVVFFYPQTDQRKFALVQTFAIALWRRHAAQAAIQSIAPTMVRTDKAVGFAFFVLTHCGGAVATTVQQHMHLFFAVAHHNHRLSAYGDGFVIARLGNFAAVCDPHPSVLVNFVHFCMKDLLIFVQRSVNTVFLYQCRVISAFLFNRDDGVHGVSSVFNFVVVSQALAARHQNAKSLQAG